MDHLEMGYIPFKHWGFFYLCSCDSGVPTQACGMLGSHWTVPCCWPYHPPPPTFSWKSTLSKFVVTLWSFILSSPALLPEDAFLGVPPPMGATLTATTVFSLSCFALWLFLALNRVWVSPSGLCCYSMIADSCLLWVSFPLPPSVLPVLVSC